MREIEYSIVVESYTLDEGGDWNRFRASLTAAIGMEKEDDSGEVLVIDSGVPELKSILNQEFPRVRSIDGTGLGYDQAKMKAAEAARGKYILFLDGDCIPKPGWKQHFLQALRSGEATALGGYTRYDGGFLAVVCSIMDFGFLYPCIRRDLKCYAFNNCAFVRDVLLQIPTGGTKVRCACYYHAQQFLRRGTPMRLVPDAAVLHEMQPWVRERTRQGFDTVAACRQDPQVPEARWLKLHALSIPLFYGMNVLLDWRRAWNAKAGLNLSGIRLAASLPVFPLLRLLDVAGMLQAFFGAHKTEAWGGNLLKRRSGILMESDSSHSR